MEVRKIEASVYKCTLKRQIICHGHLGVGRISQECLTIHDPCGLGLNENQTFWDCKSNTGNSKVLSDGWLKMPLHLGSFFQIKGCYPCFGDSMQGYRQLNINNVKKLITIFFFFFKSHSLIYQLTNMVWFSVGTFFPDISSSTFIHKFAFLNRIPWNKDN